jgi:hypothetical protein
MRHQKNRSPELVELCARMSQWRQEEGGGRGSRIPEELWQEALRVARIDGLHATAQAARLNYERLKQWNGAKRNQAPSAGVGEKRRGQVMPTRKKEQDRVAGTSGSMRIDPEHVEDAGGARFVALQMGQVSPPPLTTIELMGQNGDRMRVEVCGGVDVVGLVHRFWSRL